MKKSKRILISIISFILVLSMFISLAPPAAAAGLLEDLFDISFYNFYYLDENGKEKTDGFYNWGSSDKEENGIRIDKTGIDTIKVTINATKNEKYMTCKPVLMWVHKADGLFDTTKWTDIEQWYENKLNETFLLMVIPDYTQDSEIEVDVPMKLNLGLTGILNGGYYEMEFYGEGAIPQQLMFAYEAQTYSLEDLEKYINHDMADNIADYYNVDSGFRPETDGFSFRNSDYPSGGGVCAGIASITTAKYNGYDLTTKYKVDDVKYEPKPEYTWYDNIYGSESIHNITLQNNDFIVKNSPSLNMNEDGTANAYPLVRFHNTNENDSAFFSLLKHYLLENNKTVLLTGNSYVGNVKFANLQNRWSIIDYVASYLRQGKAVTVNISSKGQGGHAIVGYKMEQIDDDTYRLYCYDNNNPDNMGLFYNGEAKNSDVRADGTYENMIWAPTSIYIDFTKKSVVGKNNAFSQKEFEVFEFDSSNTSFPANSETGTISFSLCKGDSVGIFNYGNESNEIIAYKAFPVIKDDKTVHIRTFAFYKSGEVTEITNSVNTTVKMDYNFIGWYKIKDSQITLTKKDFKFVNSGSRYIECYVTFDNHTDSQGEIKVRIPVEK